MAAHAGRCTSTWRPVPAPGHSPSDRVPPGLERSAKLGGMDKDLIERLGGEADLWPALTVPLGRSAASQAEADSLNTHLIAQWCRFATLVADECARIAEAKDREGGCQSMGTQGHQIADNVRAVFGSVARPHRDRELRVDPYMPRSE